MLLNRETFKQVYYSKGILSSLRNKDKINSQRKNPARKQRTLLVNLCI